MPTWEVELTDGRKFQVDADSQPSEQDVLAKLNNHPNTTTANPKDFTPASEPATLSSVVDSLTGRKGGPNTIDFLKRTATGLAGQAKDAYNFASGPMMNDPAGSIFNVVKNIPSAVKGRFDAYRKDPLQTIYNDPASFMGDIAGVVGGLEGAAKLGRAAGTPIKAAMRGAANELVDNPTAGVGKSVVRGAVRGVRNAPRPTPPVEGLDRFMPNVGGANNSGVSRATSRTATVGPTPDMAVPNENAGGRLGGATTSMSLEDELVKGLTDEMLPDPAKASTGAPQVEQTKLGKPEITLDKYDENVNAANKGEYRGAGGEGDQFSQGEAADREWFDNRPRAEPRHMVNDRRQNELLGKFGGTKANPDAPEMFRSVEDPEWHSGAEPGTPEAKQASNLHRYEGEQDALYRWLVDGLKGFQVGH